MELSVGRSDIHAEVVEGNIIEGSVVEGSVDGTSILKRVCRGRERRGKEEDMWPYLARHPDPNTVKDESSLATNLHRKLKLKLNCQPTSPEMSLTSLPSYTDMSPNQQTILDDLTETMNQRVTRWFLERARLRIKSCRSLGAYGFNWRDGIPTMHHNGAFYLLSLNRDAQLMIQLEDPARNIFPVVPKLVCWI
ncbi:hypothetical protein C8J57DRAFT_1248136 [Mycena rebaudengoi]|nr:hypothetical protein C8J57DRAFT_1248136 [Mycena rebaudengoi]